MRERIALSIILILFTLFTKAQRNNIQIKYYNVDRLEIYNIVDNIPELAMVNYFEGKIYLSVSDEEINCVSFKTQKPYLNVERFKNGSYKISSGIFNSCFGIFGSNFFEKKQFELTLRDEKYQLVYYLAQLTDDDIYSKIQTGTGILLNSNTLLTNYHVVKSASKLTIEFQDKLFAGRVVKFDENLDIAEVRIEGNIIIDNQYLNFAGYHVEIGNLNFALGYPMINSMGKELKITSGIISSTKGFNDDENYMQTTAPIDPGNSGGPLIDEFGNIIGIASAKHSTGTNVGYALKIKPLIDGKYSVKTTLIKHRLTTQQIYQKAKKSVCIIKSYIF